MSPGYLLKVRAVFDLEKEGGWRFTDGVPTQVVEGAPGIGKDGSEVAILICSDGRALTIVGAAGEQIAGRLSVGNYFFKRFDGRLKISGSNLWEAETCPIE